MGIGRVLLGVGALVIHMVGLIAVKPVVVRDLSFRAPESLVELKPGTYYMLGEFQQARDMVSIIIPNGAKYEMRCIGRGPESGYGSKSSGLYLIKLKRTDQDIRCSLLTLSETDRLPKEQQ